MSPLRRARACLRRFGLLLRRALAQGLRDSALHSARMGVYAVLAVLIGAVYGPKAVGSPSESVSNRVNSIASGAIDVAMLSVVAALQVFQRERVLVGRERAQGLYAAPEYLLAHTLSAWPSDALAAAVSPLDPSFPPSSSMMMAMGLGVRVAAASPGGPAG